MKNILEQKPPPTPTFTLAHILSVFWGAEVWSFGETSAARDCVARWNINRKFVTTDQRPNETRGAQFELYLVWTAEGARRCPLGRDCKNTRTQSVCVRVVQLQQCFFYFMFSVSFASSSAIEPPIWEVRTLKSTCFFFSFSKSSLHF